jgi:hypothetical protein
LQIDAPEVDFSPSDWIMIRPSVNDDFVAAFTCRPLT